MSQQDKRKWTVSVSLTVPADSLAEAMSQAHAAALLLEQENFEAVLGEDYEPEPTEVVH